MKSLLKRIKDWHSWIDYKNFRFVSGLMLINSIFPLILFVMVNPFNFSFLLVDEYTKSAEFIIPTIVFTIIVNLFFTYILYHNEVDIRKIAKWSEKKETEWRQWVDDMWEWVYESEFKQLVEDTPENLRYDLVVVLYNRHLAIIEESLKNEFG